jgi:hypothetical protein
LFFGGAADARFLTRPGCRAAEKQKERTRFALRSINRQPLTGFGTRLHVLPWLAWLLLFLRLAAPLHAQQSALEEGPTRFCAMDIFIDSKSAPLAAWQIEFAATNGLAKIVGIEGGEAGPFHNPPFYDPKAIQNDRVIIAAFSTELSTKLPAGKTRVATIHLQITGTAQPQFELKLQAAADPDGKKIPVEISFEERKKS